MAFFQDDGEGAFHASSLAKWFHSTPHKDFQLDDTTTIFSPADESYREALYLLALFIASCGALLFLLLVIYYTCCYCVCKKPRATYEHESCRCSKSCLQLQIIILALICCGALVVGFVYNGKTSDGVDQFRNSVGDIQDDINSASKMGKKMSQTLQMAKNNIGDLSDESGSPYAEEAFHLTFQMIVSLNYVNNLLPEQVMNESSDAGDKVHHYDNYRWLATVILLAWCIFVCIFLFWTGCQINGFTLVITTILCLITVLCTWAVTGADFGVATGVGDFCVNPKRAIQSIKKGNATSIVISYYMDCTNYDPFSKNLQNLSATLEEVIQLIGKVPNYPQLKTEILRSLNDVEDKLPLFEENFSCGKIHKEYIDAMDGLCEKALNSLGVVMLSVFVIAVFSGLVTCCTCPLWGHRKPRPTTYNDVQNSPDDVGNAMLWWPHDVDARSDHSFYQRHGEPTERSPLINNQPRQEPGGGNHANVNFIHVNYNGVPPPMTNEAPTVPSNHRHSF